MNRTLGAPAALGEIIKVWLNVTAFVLHVLYHNHSPQKQTKSRQHEENLLQFQTSNS